MSQVALYRAWRPMDFDAVVAQQQVVQTLKQAVKSGDIGHAYLFCGTRGTGKTSLAKILARAVNCLRPREGNPCNACPICLGILDASLLDVQEIDAASNNSVDNIRRLIDEIVFLPLSAKYKVYIIDEVHMLSTGAFNALLKTLEEPPAHAIFVLATTEPHRIPATILSRCQRFDFRRIPDEAIADRLRKIADDEKIRIDEAAIEAIAALGDGALRDAISLLDQCRLSFPAGIQADSVLALVGSVNKLLCAELAEGLLRDDIAAVLTVLATVVAEGKDLARFSTELAGFFRDLMVARVAPGRAELIAGSQAEKNKIAELAPAFELAGLRAALLDLSALAGELRWSDQARLSVELCLIKIAGRLKRAGDPAPSNVSASEPQPPTAPKAQAKAPVLLRQPDVLPKTETSEQKNETPAPALPPKNETPAPPPDASPKSPTASPLALLSEDELALLSPERLSQLRRGEQEAESPTQLPQGAWLHLPDGSLNAESLLQIWQKTLGELGPFLYLFAQDIQPRPQADALELFFTKTQEPYYNVMSSAQADEMHQLWKRNCAPDTVPLRLVADFSAGETKARPEPPEDDWIARIRRLATENNIPFEEEQ